MLVVNYFGLFDRHQLKKITRKYSNVIIDNSQAFFAKPNYQVLNIYSPRKFFGVPDGCYVIGKNAEKNEELYQYDISSETSAFLLKRIELGCSKVYNERQENEMRIEMSGIRRMSKLTQTLLSCIDYKRIKLKRKENFEYAKNLFISINQIDIEKLIGKDVIPMVYPLVVERDDLVELLKRQSVYTGRWWSHVIKEVDHSKIEYYYSRYLIPIPIDQRYGKQEIDHIHSIIKDSLK